MATKTIYVSLQGNANSRKLRLRDSNGGDAVNDLITGVDTDNKVKWVADPTPPLKARRILSIDDVYYKKVSGNVNILTAKPTRQSDGSWIARVVSISPGRGRQHKYNIKFTRVGYTTSNKCDPKLQMN